MQSSTRNTEMNWDIGGIGNMIGTVILEGLGMGVLLMASCALGMLPLFYPLVQDGKLRSRLLQRRMEAQEKEMPEYFGAFMKMFGGARPYITRRSCRNQFYSDLITPLPDHIQVPGTEIHVFYTPKMGEKYEARYRKHFADPVIHRQDMQHEKLLVCHPEQWAALVASIIGQKAQV